MTRPGDGQTALVTGASAGIGVDLAECFARDGYDLILTARTEDALREVADRLAKAHGVAATPIALDLGAIGGGAKLADAITARGLSVDVLVREEARGTGVKVSCLCPGPTVSKFRARAGTDKVKLSQAGKSMPSATVAQMGFDGWQANTRVVVTGTRNRVMASLVRFMPRTAVLRAVRNLQSPL